jgi:hypothetical protein
MNSGSHIQVYFSVSNGNGLYVGVQEQQGSEWVFSADAGAVPIMAGYIPIPTMYLPSSWNYRLALFDTEYPGTNTTPLAVTGSTTYTFVPPPIGTQTIQVSMLQEGTTLMGEQPDSAVLVFSESVLQYDAVRAFRGLDPISDITPVQQYQLGGGGVGYSNELTINFYTNVVLTYLDGITFKYYRSDEWRSNVVIGEVSANWPYAEHINVYMAEVLGSDYSIQFEVRNGDPTGKYISIIDASPNPTWGSMLGEATNSPATFPVANSGIDASKNYVLRLHSTNDFNSMPINVSLPFGFPIVLNYDSQSFVDSALLINYTANVNTSNVGAYEVKLIIDQGGSWVDSGYTFNNVDSVFIDEYSPIQNGMPAFLSLINKSTGQTVAGSTIFYINLA